MGNKRRIAGKVIQHFPHASTIDLYVEPFFGAGGIFFNKEKSKYNILNDSDSDVYNLFCVLNSRKKDLETAWKGLPIHVDLFNEWKHYKPEDPVLRACRFLLISNFTYLCKGGTFMFNRGNATKLLYERIAWTHERIFGCEFSNFDFRQMFNKVRFRDDNQKAKSFIYADPPYLNTANNYEQNKWTQTDSSDLFDVLDGTGARYAMSEFHHPFIIAEAKKRGLKIITIGERQNIKNRRTEVLIVNYN